MTVLADKMHEKTIIDRIKRLVDEGNKVEKVSINAIAMACGVEKSVIYNLYNNNSNKKRITEQNRKKISAGLDKLEIKLKMTKVCGTCGQELPVGQFSRCKSSKDGLYYQCKKCKESRRQAVKEAKKEQNKGVEKPMNNNKDVAITAEIVRRVKAEDKLQVESKFMAPYFGITPKQLDEIRMKQWDSLLLTPKVPEKAESVLASVEALRGEVASLRREVQAVLIELGVEVK